MSRRRLLLASLPTAGLLLGLAAAALWVRGLWVLDSVCRGDAAGSLGKGPFYTWYFSSGGGGLQINYLTLRRPSMPDQTTPPNYQWTWTTTPSQPLYRGWPMFHVSHQTVQYTSAGMAPDTMDNHLLAVGLWLPTLTLLPPSLLALLYLHRTRPGRFPPGSCPHCGYDLRATPTHCPECGHTPTVPPTHSPTRNQEPGTRN